MRDRLDGWELKRLIRESGVFGYEVAAALKITESALSKRLRNPSKEQYAEIERALESVKKRKAS